MKCESCGHSLSAEELRGEECPYCNTALPHVREAIAKAAKLKEILRDEDGDGIPDILKTMNESEVSNDFAEVFTETTEQHVERKVSAHSYEADVPKSRTNTIVGFIIVCAVLLTIGILYIKEMKSSESHKNANFACLVDANGDGVLDIAAQLQKFPMGKEVVTSFGILSGVDGSILSEKTMLEGQEKFRLFCVNQDWVMLTYPNFNVEFYNTRNTAAPTRILLSDALQSFAMDDNCISLKTRDGKTSGFSLPEGIVKECGHDELKGLHDKPETFMGLTDSSAQLTDGDRRYELKTRKSGSKVLALAAYENEKELWRKQLPYVKPQSTGLALHDETLAIWALEPGKDQEGLLIGFDINNGSQRYAQKALSPYPTSSLRLIENNGRFFVVNAFSSLWFFDPKTGEVHWSIKHQ